MKKFSPPEMKEVSFPTPYTPHPTPHTPHPTPSFKSERANRQIILVERIGQIANFYFLFLGGNFSGFL
jgi:hypothetical protein